MNVDFIYQIIDGKIRIYLLEINPRMGGSIHISIHSGLLKSYFDYLIYKRKHKRVIKYKNIEIEKWSNHRYTTLIPYIFDNINVVMNIDNLNNHSKFSLM
jgi:carbamoylphosphate synthase large subunit